MEVLQPQATAAVALAFLAAFGVATPASADNHKLGVDARSNLFGAGAGGVGANGGGLSPPGARFAPGPGKVVRVTKVSGKVSCCGGGDTFNDADGGTNAGGSTDINSSGGISGITHPSRTMFLAGLFLDDGTPMPPGPPRLDATSPDNRQPKLYQSFFVGSGSGGAAIEVPPTATRLVLGFVDANGFQGSPGRYDDNAGSLMVSLQIEPATAARQAYQIDFLRWWPRTGMPVFLPADSLDPNNPIFMVQVRALDRVDHLVVRINEIEENAPLVQVVPGSVPHSLYQTTLLSFGPPTPCEPEGGGDPGASPSLPHHIAVGEHARVRATVAGETKDIFVGTAPVIPILREDFTPDKARLVFQNLRSIYQAELEASVDVPADMPHLLNPDAERLYKYRLGLVDRYLEIDGLYRAKEPVELPGPQNRTYDHEPFREIHLAVIASVYMNLVREPPPAFTASGISNRLVWNTVEKRRIYFDTEKEENALYNALSHCLVKAQRDRIKSESKAAIEGTLNGLGLYPGFNITRDLYVLINGQRITGEQATALDKVMAVVDLGLQAAPIASGALRARATLNAPFKDPLFRHLTDQGKWARQLRTVRGQITKQEAVMTQWMTEYYAWRRLSAVEMQYGGRRGIDFIVRGQQKLIVDELKMYSDFDGSWEKTGLVENTDVRVNLPGVAGKYTNQGSWSWFLDRTMKAYKWAKANGRLEMAADARNVVEQFVAGKLARRWIVMNDQGQAFVGHESQIASLSREASGGSLTPPATVTELKASAMQWLAENP